MSTFRAWFVTGTDTGAGKTFATCALIHAARAKGFTTLGMKPVAAGAELLEGHWINEDAAQIQAASSFDPGLNWINPYCLHAPVSPHIAARAENVRIDPTLIREAFEHLASQCSRLFVEGAGGFLAPWDQSMDASRIALDLALPLILVVGMKLGCINHALLTVEAIASRGLRLKGWIANCLYTDVPCLDDNIDFLRHRINAPLLGTLPCVPDRSAESLVNLITLPV